MDDLKDQSPDPGIPGVAHDVRQMLWVITGRCGQLLQGNLPPEVQRHLRAMELAAADASAMLARLPGVGGAPSDPGAGQLHPAVAAALQLVLPPDGRPWQEPGSEGPWRARVDVPAHLWAGVPAQVLREVLGNLLTNALAVLPRGGQVDIAARRRGGRCLLTVQDSGPGVPPHRADLIFQPGFTTSGQPGRGLGLAGCRALLRRHGADLRLDGTAGPGGCFLLDLPAAAPQIEPDPATAGQDDQETGPILVVDDEAAVRDMLADLLGELGRPPVLAADAEAARAVFSPGGFGLALIDQNLPGLSGLELASLLRREDPAVVLVLVSGWGNEDIVARATGQGCDLAVEKPLTVDKIRHIIGQAAALRRQRAEEREET